MDKNSGVQNSAWVAESVAALNPAEGWQPDVSDAFIRFKDAQGRTSLSNGRWAFAVAASAALCFCLMFLPSPKVLAHRCLECSVAVWKSLLPVASGQTSLKPPGERLPAPEFNLRDANDNDIKSIDLRGKVVLVNFWATWCHGCQTEIPWFIEFQKEYAGQGLVVVGISMDDDGWKSVRPWLKEKKVNYPVVIGNKDLGDQFGLYGMPLTVLVDREGRIADVRPGVVDKAPTQQKIKTLLQENPKNPSD